MGGLAKFRGRLSSHVWGSFSTTSFGTSLVSVRWGLKSIGDLSSGKCRGIISLIRRERIESICDPFGGTSHREAPERVQRVLHSSEAFFPYLAYLQLAFRVSCRPTEYKRIRVSELSLEVLDNTTSKYSYYDVIAKVYQRKYGKMIEPLS